MSRKISTEGYFMHSLTKITLRENYDGIHVKETTIGYVAEEPFCVLTELLCDYYVSKYCINEIFPLGFFSGKYSLGIYDVGSRYDLDNFVKHAYHDLSRFLKYCGSKDLGKAAILSEDSLSSEYIGLLNTAVNNGDLSIQLAIEYNDIIQNVQRKDESVSDYNKRIHQYFLEQDIEKMHDIDLKDYFLIQQYVFKRVAEQMTMD